MKITIKNVLRIILVLSCTGITQVKPSEEPIWERKTPVNNTADEDTLSPEPINPPIPLIEATHNIQQENPDQHFQKLADLQNVTNNPIGLHLFTENHLVHTPPTVHITDKLDVALNDLHKRTQQKKYAEACGKKIKTIVSVGLTYGAMRFNKTYPKETSAALTILLAGTGLTYGTLLLKKRGGYRLSATEETFLEYSKMIGQEVFSYFKEIVL